MRVKGLVRPSDANESPLVRYFRFALLELNRVRVTYEFFEDLDR